MSEQNNLQSFFYTFGTSKYFPYQKGWVEVKAADRGEADKLFRKHHPDRTEGILNCAFVYDQTTFEEMQTRSPMPPDWSVCHNVLSPEGPSERIEPIRMSFADQIQNAQNRVGIEPSTPPTKETPER